MEEWDDWGTPVGAIAVSDWRAEQVRQSSLSSVIKEPNAHRMVYTCFEKHLTTLKKIYAIEVHGFIDLHHARAYRPTYFHACVHGCRGVQYVQSINASVKIGEMNQSKYGE